MPVRGCTHLRAIATVKHPRRRVCEDCGKINGSWVRLARITHERTVNYPGVHANGESCSGERPSGSCAGYQSHVAPDGYGVERRQRCLIRPGPATTRASIELALFAGFIRE